MTRPRANTAVARPHRVRAFTLIDATLAVLVVSLVVVVALEAAGTSVRTQTSLTARETGDLFAESLAAEILQKRYQTPLTVTGLLVTLLNPNDRSNKLGADAYAGFSESPLRSADGTAISDATWSRTVTVEYWDPQTRTPSLLDTHLRRITVTVTKSGRTVSRRYLLKAAD